MFASHPSRRPIGLLAAVLSAGPLVALGIGPAAAVPVASATYAAHTTTNLVSLTESTAVVGSLADAQVGATTADAAAHPQTAAATAANLRAVVAGLDVPLSSVTQSAPPDNTAPATDDVPPLTVPTLLSAAVLHESAQARDATGNTCLAAGMATSTATTTAASAAVGTGLVPALPGGSSLLGDVADLTALSSTSTTSLVAATGPADTRAVQSQATATIGTLALLNSAVTASVEGAGTLTAQATGDVSTSTASYDAPQVSVSVNGGPSTSLNDVGSVTVPIDLRVAGIGLAGSATLTLGTLSGVQNTGTAVSASASVLDAHVTLDDYTLGLPTVNVADVTLSVAPMTVSATGPADGVQCSTAASAPVITSPVDGATLTTNQPTISGTGTSGDPVTVTDGNGGTVCGPVTVDDSGHWTCTPSAGLPTGSTTLTATEDGPGGAVASAPVTITVLPATPDAPTITSPDNGSTVNDATVAFTGTGTSGDAVTVTDTGSLGAGGGPICTATVDSSGAWHCSPATPLSVGTHTAVATQKDPDTELTSPPSDPVTFTAAVIRNRYTPLTPYRVLDTRAAVQHGPVTGPVPAGHSVTLSATQLGLHNTSASAVVLNLTVTGPVGSGFVTAYPTDQTRPGVSSSNFARGQTRANLVIVPLAADGSVTIYTSTATQLVADVFGYFASNLSAASGGLFHAITPARLLDTRSTGTPLTANSTRTLPVAGFGGVPVTGVGAVVLNVTITGPTADSYVSAYPTGATFARSTSNINFVPNDIASTRVIVPLGAAGAVSFYNRFGTVSLVIDVVGYLTDSTGTDTTGSQFVAVAPTRRVDSRIGLGTVQAPLAKNSTRSITLAGATVPTVGTVAVVANLTAVYPTARGYLTQYATGITRPVVSDVNFIANEIVPNLVISAVDSSGASTVYNSTAPVTQFVEDLTGYFTTTAGSSG